eukprot:69566_1
MSIAVSIGVVDFGKKSEDYARYRPGMPDDWYLKLDKLIEEHYGVNYKNLNLNILDLGCGPGIVALELLKRYKQYTIIGVDISENQIKFARKRLMEEFHEISNKNKCKFYVGSADNMKHIQQIKNNSIDIVICSQCWPWFDHKKTFLELQRIFNNKIGLLVIAQYCYLPQLSEIAYLTEKLILRQDYNPIWKHANWNGIYPKQIEQILNIGYPFFIFDKLICYDYNQPFSLFTWIKRINTCNAIHGLNDDQLDVFNEELKKTLEDYLYEKYSQIPETFYVKHRIWTLVAKVNGNRISRL